MRFAGYMRAAVTRFGVKCPAKDDRAKADAMMTKDEARRAVEVELQSRKLTKPMMLDQLNVFCEEMYKRLQFKSKSERLADILIWAHSWQSKNLPSN
jgi:hypothetical protein